MKIVDRYLLRAFLKSLLLSVVIFLFIICITYIFDRINIIFKFNAPLSLFLLSLWYSLPNWFALVFPVAGLLAVLFSLGDLARNNEITALRTSGLSILRVSVSVIFTGLFLTIFFVFFNNTVLVNSNKHYTRIWKYKIKKQKPQLAQGYNIVQIENDKIFSAKTIDPKTEKITGLILLELDANMKLTEKIVAREAFWKEGNLELVDVSFSRFSNNRYSIKKFRTKKIPFDKKPSEFLNIKRNPDEMTYNELAQLIVRLDKSGIPSHQEQTHKHSKLAKPFAILVMLLLGIPFAVKMARTAKIFSFAVAIFIGFLYWGAVSISMALGMSRTLSPVVSAWFANILFLVIAAILIYRTERI
ncbi:MAG: LptF/LptG family permease [Elusimicrobiota bacterium]